MDAKLSVLIGSKAVALYCCFRSPGENSPMINTREPIKKLSLAANCIKLTLMWCWKRIRIHGEGFLFYFYFLQKPTQQFQSSHYRLLSICGLLLNHWASTLIISNWLAAGESGFTPCYGVKGWVLTSFPPLIRWRAKWQGHWGGGGEASVYSKDNTFRRRFLYTVACRDQTLRLLFFHSAIEFVSVLWVRLFFSH